MKFMRGVVDQVIGAELAQAFESLFAAGAGNDFGPSHFGQKHAARAHPATRAKDQHPLAGLHLPLGQHHAMRRAVGYRQGGGIGKTDPIGDANELVYSSSAALGQAAMDRLAHEAAFDAVNRVEQQARPPPSLGHQAQVERSHRQYPDL